MKKTYIPYNSVRYLIDEGEIKSLAFYLKLKLFYKNGIIYDYSIKELSLKFKISPFLINKFIDYLNKKGLIRISEGHLISNSFRKLRELGSDEIPGNIILNIKRNDSISTICDKIRFSVMKKSVIDRQNYITKTYDSLNNLERRDTHVSKIEYSSTMSKYKKLSSIGYSFLETEYRSNENIVGYRKLSKLIGLSVASIRKFLQRMKNWGYIKSFHVKREFLGISSFGEKYARDIICSGKLGHIYSYKGKLSICYGTVISI